jgi:hypothetical protein
VLATTSLSHTKLPATEPAACWISTSIVQKMQAKTLKTASNQHNVNIFMSTILSLNLAPAPKRITENQDKTVAMSRNV